MDQICPVCGKEYQTDLDRPEGDDRLIQYIFPNATSIQREQLITGVCSYKCWDSLCGEEEEEEEEDEISEDEMRDAEAYYKSEYPY